MLEAKDKERIALLEVLQDAPLGKDGHFYTSALQNAITKLEPPRDKAMAREVLAGRMARMTISTIAEYLQEDGRELRLAGVTALRFKSNISAAGLVIPLLTDRDREVAGAALETLKSLSDMDFGMSVERWRRWFETNKDKKPK